MSNTSWFDDENVMADVATSDADIEKLFGQLSSRSVRECIETLIERYDTVTQPTDIELSHLFFILSEIKHLHESVRDFCLDAANFIALDSESRVEKFDIKAEFENIKALADVRLPSRG